MPRYVTNVTKIWPISGPMGGVSTKIAVQALLKLLLPLLCSCYRCILHFIAIHSHCIGEPVLSAHINCLHHHWQDH